MSKSQIRLPQICQKHDVIMEHRNQCCHIFKNKYIFPINEGSKPC